MKVEYDRQHNIQTCNQMYDPVQIPILTSSSLDSIPNNTLVKCVGMVQDMFNPEYFVSEYKDPNGNWHTTRYGDDVAGDIAEGCETKFDERHPMLVVPIPACSQWMMDKTETAAFESVLQFQTGAPQKREKRSLDTDDMAVDQSNSAQDVPPGNSSVNVDDSAAAAAPHGAKKASGEQPANNTKDSSIENQLENIPHGSCVVHIYDGSGGVKLNDMVQVIGILSRVPGLAPYDAMDEDQEGIASKIPTSVAPRVHAISITKLTSSWAEPQAPLDSSTIQQARTQTKEFLSALLGGDEVAAEYLLMQIISRVHMRTQDSGASALGTMPMNLTGVPDKSPGFAQELSNALSLLLPSVKFLALDIDSLNRSPWYPCKLQNQAFLSVAPLQLPAGTVVLLDETAMTAGQLTETGLKNLGAIQTMMQLQKLPYDFQFYQLDQPTDQPIIIISVGKTMLHGAGEIQVPLKPTPSSLQNGNEIPSVTQLSKKLDLNLVRQYISLVRHMEFSIPQDMERQIEKDMTQARKKDASNVNAATFHCWLNVRLCCR